MPGRFRVQPDDNEITVSSRHGQCAVYRRDHADGVSRAQPPSSRPARPPRVSLCCELTGSIATQDRARPGRDHYNGHAREQIFEAHEGRNANLQPCGFEFTNRIKQRPGKHKPARALTKVGARVIHRIYAWMNEQNLCGEKRGPQNDEKLLVLSAVHTSTCAVHRSIHHYTDVISRFFNEKRVIHRTHNPYDGRRVEQKFFFTGLRPTSALTRRDQRECQARIAPHGHTCE